MSPTERPAECRADPPVSGAGAVSARDWRHLGAFVIGGLLAFCVDGGVLMILTRLAGAPALAARLVAIALAMVVSWLFHRTVTFPVVGPPTAGEFLRFAALGWTTAAFNYAVFALMLLLLPALHPLLAVVVASACAMVLSYFGMRLGVFAKSV